MRTEEEVKKEMAELGEKFDILQNSDSATMWQYWEEDKALAGTTEACRLRLGAFSKGLGFA